MCLLCAYEIGGNSYERDQLDVTHPIFAYEGFRHHCNLHAHLCAIVKF